MSKLKCNDCGTTFESTMDSCPTCGCPVNYCNVVEAADKVCENSDDGSECYQNYYYIDFDWFKKFSSDPLILILLMKVPFLKWLCAPWHISETNNTLNHQIANDVFFLSNRFWKLLIYGGVWAICKGLPIIIADIVLIAFMYNKYFVDWLFTFIGEKCYYIVGSFLYWHHFKIILIMIILNLISFVWLNWIGLGKSYKRYGIPFIAALRHLYVTVSKDIKDNLK